MPLMDEFSEEIDDSVFQVELLLDSTNNDLNSASDLLYDDFPEIADRIQELISVLDDIRDDLEGALDNAR